MKKQQSAESSIIFDGTVAIPETIHKEYIEYGSTINISSYDYKRVLKESNSALFDPHIPEEIQKKLIYLLGQFATAESYKMLKKYVDSLDTTLVPWATLALQEIWFAIENDMHDGNKDMVMSPSGGKGNAIRYYTAFAAEKRIRLTNTQKKIIRQLLQSRMKRFNCEVEEISFTSNYCLTTLLIPMTVAPQTPIDAFLDITSTNKHILKYHFMITNVQPFTPEKIHKYLASLT